MESETEETARLVREIAAYLNTHPHAADTLEGIRGWWLSEEQSFGVRPEALEQALEQLVASGQLTRVKSVNGQVLYVNRRGRRLH